MSSLKVSNLFWLIALLTIDGFEGKEFIPKETKSAFLSLTKALGSVIGNGNLTNDVVRDISSSLNEIAEIMQGIGKPNGAPPFVDERGLIELEELFTHVGAYACLLPKHIPKDLNNLGHVMGGLVGGLVGSTLADSIKKSGKDAEQRKSILSGVGSIAGAYGGLAGHNVKKGSSGVPNIQSAIKMIPNKISAIGDIKKVLQGSFKPLAGDKFSNIRGLVRKELGFVFNKLAGFINEAADMFKDKKGATKLSLFESRFKLSPEFNKEVKELFTMSALIGGTFGFILPRMHWNGDFGDFDIESSISNMKDIKGRKASGATDIFDGLYDELAKSAAEIGGFTGIIGGMMLEVLGNSESVQMSQNFMHSSNKHGSRKLSGFEFQKRLNKAIPSMGRQHFSFENTKCIEYLAEGLDNFGKLHKFIHINPDSLDYKGPYGKKGDSADMDSLEKTLVGQQWNGKWSLPPTTAQLNKDITREQLSSVLDSKALDENAVIKFVNNAVAGSKTRIVSFLRGTVAFNDLTSLERKDISADIIAGLKPSVISSLNAVSLVDILTSNLVNGNPERLKNFFQSLTDQQVNSAVTRSMDLKDQSLWNSPSNLVSAMFAIEIMERFDVDGFDKICPFINGISPNIMEKATPDIFTTKPMFMNCLESARDHLTSQQKKVVIKPVMMMGKKPSVDLLKSLKSFSAELPKGFLSVHYNESELTALLDGGHFSNMKHLCHEQQESIAFSVVKKLGVNSTNTKSASILRKLGTIICGISPSKLQDLVSLNDLSTLQSNWTKKCIKEPYQALKDKLKLCQEKRTESMSGMCNKACRMKSQKDGDRLQKFDTSRSFVKNLAHLSGNLPLSLAVSLNSLTRSEIKQIPSEVFDNSLEVVAANNKLSKLQKREISAKLLGDSKKLESVEDMKSFGSLLVGTNASRFNTKILQFAFIDRPDLWKKFPNNLKLILSGNFMRSSGDNAINQKTIFSPMLPAYLIRNASSLNMPNVSASIWSRPQAIALVKRYKELNNKAKLNLDDINTLGTATAGLTCEDVADLPLFSMVEISCVIGNTVGDRISADLANCIAMKLHLFLRMHHQKMIDINKVVGRMIPGNILLFLPSSLLMKVAYSQHCSSMIMRLGHANINLLPRGPDQLAINGILQATSICSASAMEREISKMIDLLGDALKKGLNDFDLHDIKDFGASKNMPKSMDDGSKGIPKSLDDASKNIPKSMDDGSKGIPKSLDDASKSLPKSNGRALRNLPKSVEDKHGQENFHKSADKSYEGMQMEYGKENTEYMQYEDGYSMKNNKAIDEFRGHIDENFLKQIGKFACRISNINESLDYGGLLELGLAISHCKHRMGKSGRDNLRHMLTHKIDSTKTMPKKHFSSIGPLLLFAEPKVIEEMSDENISFLAKNIPLMEKPKRLLKPLVGDKSKKSLSLRADLLLPVPKDMPEIELEIDPINLRPFADAVFPKLYRHMLNLQQERKVASSNSSYGQETGVTYEMVLWAGPAILGMSESHIRNMSDVTLRDSIFLMGQYSGWNSAQLGAIKSRLLSIYGGVSTWSAGLLEDLGQLALMFDTFDIDAIRNLQAFGLTGIQNLNWKSNDFRSSLLLSILQAENINSISHLPGPYLASFGDVLCGINIDDIGIISADAMKFALSYIGKLRCLDGNRILKFKKRAFDIMQIRANEPSFLSEIGILVGAYTADELRSIQPIHTSLIHPNALRIVNASDILKAWSVAHFAKMGPLNGAVILARPDIFKKLNAKRRNAVFRAAFGSNTGLVSSEIEMMKNGEKVESTSYQHMIANLMGSVSALFVKLNPGIKQEPKRGGPGSVYGLDDPEFFIKPSLPEFAEGLSVDDFTAFKTKDLENIGIRNFINKISASNDAILNVMKGNMDLNDLMPSDIKSMPPKIFQGMKDTQIQAMSASTIESLFDSDTAARDPRNMEKVIAKLDMTKLEETLQLMSEKVVSTSGDIVPWRPPTELQEVLVKNYVKRITSAKLTDAEIVDKFVQYMGPVAAGISTHLISKIPRNERWKEVLNCFGKSYLDLSTSQRKKIVQWAAGRGKAKATLEITDLGQFSLDVPLHEIRKTLTVETALLFVTSGSVTNLDKLHPNFEPFTRLLLKIIIKNQPEEFDKTSFLDKLGPSQCNIPLNKLKSSMTDKSIKHLAMYTINNCKGKDTSMDELEEQCMSEEAKRLKRCSMKKETSARTGAKSSRRESLSVNQFMMAREMSKILLGDKDLSSISAQELKESAGALVGLTPLDIDKIPENAIRESLSVIKDNTNLSPDQKKRMFKKARSAGIPLDSAAGLQELGELVTEVPAEDLLKIPPADILSSMADLKKKKFSRSQKRAISAKLQESDIDQVLQSDLGDFAAEIPLKNLKQLQSVNLTEVKDKMWGREQAASLVEMYLEDDTESELTVEVISEMGNMVIGLKCNNIMELEYYDALEAAIAIDSQSDMTPDMDECIQSKVHFSMQVDKGVNYTSNDTDDELEALLESIPEDVIAMFPHDVLMTIPNAICEMVFQKIGQSQVYDLPPGPGDVKRQRLAKAAMDCKERSAVLNRRSTRESEIVLEEEDVLKFGDLIWDIDTKYLKGLTSSGFDASLSYLREPRITRFTRSHSAEFQALVHKHMGEPSTWDEAVLSSLGSAVTLLDPSDIEKINEEIFFDSINTISPPIMQKEDEAYDLINYDAFYKKAKNAIVSQSQSSRRRKRTAETPTFDNIIALGSGNSQWTVEELERISNADLINALSTLGNVPDWSSSQMDVLKNKITLALSVDGLANWPSEKVADAKHILTSLTVPEISSLKLSELDTITSLSDLSWSNEQRTAALDNYLSTASTAVEALTSQTISGLGSMFCGMSANNMASLAKEAVSDSLSDIGELTCYNQDQLDTLFQLVTLDDNANAPDAGLIQSMGSIAAGMSTVDLQQIPKESMPFFTISAINLMDPVRFRDGITATQLSASGTTNVAAIIRNTNLYDSLSIEQRNALQTAAYGTEAVIVAEEVEETTQITDNSVINQSTSETVLGTDDDEIQTTTDGASTLKAQYILLLSIVFITYFL